MSTDTGRQAVADALDVILRLSKAAQLIVADLDARQAPPPEPAPQPEPRQVVYSGLDVERRNPFADPLFVSKFISTQKQLKTAAGSRASPELRQASDELIAILVSYTNELLRKAA